MVDFVEAEKELERYAESELASALKPSLDAHTASSSLFRRMSRRASVVAPVLKKIGLTSDAHPGLLKPSEIADAAQLTILDEYKRTQGYLAFSALLRAFATYATSGLLKALLCVRKSWHVVARSTNNSESALDVPTLLRLIEGVFMLGLSHASTFYATIFSRVLGIRANGALGVSFIQSCANARDDKETPLIEAREEVFFGHFALIAYFLLVSERVYDPNRIRDLKAAEKIVEDQLARHPKWILFLVLRSHVFRRLGRIDESVEALEVVAPVVETQLASLPLEPPMSQSILLDFDRGALAFQRRDFPSAVKTLQPCVLSESTFTRKVLACALTAAAHGAMGDVVESVKWLDIATDLERDTSFFFDSAFAFKIETLKNRPHKSLLQHELSYMLGHAFSFELKVSESWAGGGAKAKHWLGTMRKELEAIVVSSEASVVYPEFPTTQTSATEELLAAAFMDGVVAVCAGDWTFATKRFEFVLSNAERKLPKKIQDPYHVGFALYELGCLEIRKGNYDSAKTRLASAKSKARKHNFSFAQLLEHRISLALRFIATEVHGVEEHVFDQQRVDELGVFSGVDGLTSLDGMSRASVGAGKIEIVPHAVRRGQEVGWTYVVATHEMSVEIKVDDEVLEDAVVCESGDVHASFFTATQDCVLKLVFDNSKSDFVDKKVLYSVTKS